MAKSPQSKTIDEEAVRKLADLLDETGLTEIEYGEDNWSIRVSKGATATAVAAPAAAAAPAPAGHAAAETAEPDHAAHPGAVTSPMVGVVYTSPDPGSPAFVKEGDTVTEGQTVLLVEAMKVFNQITAPRAGRVTKILVESGTPVEFGEPLMIIE